jgi:hypothetical protein
MTKDMQKRVAYFIVTVLTLAATIFFGVTFPLPDEEAQLRTFQLSDDFTALGLSNFSSIQTDIGEENIGLPTVATAAITYVSTGAIFTIADGEIWIVHDLFVHTTTNFDCTGSDCTMDIGDGADADGFIDAADAHIQAAVTDYTGGPAGWIGLDGAAPKGVYLVGGDHVYAPSGADETIDIAIAGTDPAAGVATVYLVYTRVQ